MAPRLEYLTTMLTFGVFGIDNDALNTAVNVLILILIVVWAALVFWTFADARRRIDDPMLVGCATLAALFPFVGTIVYTIVRPPEFLDDVRLRELEMQAAEARLVALDYQLCPHCDYEVKSEYLRCPNCSRKLMERCPTCARAVDPAWTLCPYCETELGQPAASSGRRRRRSRETGETRTVSDGRASAGEGRAAATESHAPAEEPLAEPARRSGRRS